MNTEAVADLNAQVGFDADLRDKIKECLEKNGLTQKEGAKKLGVSETALSRFMSGGQATKTLILRSRTTFGISLDEIIADEKAMQDTTLPLEGASV